MLANGMIQWDDYFGKIRFIIAARRRMFICRRYGYDDEARESEQRWREGVELRVAEDILTNGK